MCVCIIVRVVQEPDHISTVLTETTTPPPAISMALCNELFKCMKLCNTQLRLHAGKQLRGQMKEKQKKHTYVTKTRILNGGEKKS